MPKKNIITLTGNNSYKIDREIDRFVEAFRERQDDVNIDTYWIDEITNWNNITQDSQALGLFASKRLFIFRGSLPKSRKKATPESEEEGISSKTKETEAAIIHLCERANDDTFIIIACEYDEKSQLKKWLTDNSDLRSFETLWEASAWNMLFPDLDTTLISDVLREYKKTLGEKTNERLISYAIAGSLEKLSLIRLSDTSIKMDEQEGGIIEGNTVIFGLSDALLRGDFSRGLTLLHTLLDLMSIHAIVPTLIGSLRTSIYVKILKQHGLSLVQIKSLLNTHPFSIEKSYSSTISTGLLRDLYSKIIDCSIAYKSGKGRSDSELGYIFDIELVLLGLKK